MANHVSSVAHYGATATTTNGRSPSAGEEAAADVEASSSEGCEVQAEGESKPLVTRQAFSMDYDDYHSDTQDSSESFPPASDPPPYVAAPLHSRLISAYVLLGTLLFGFALGYTVSFWTSSNYWRSERGLEILGCYPEEEGVAVPEGEEGGAGVEGAEEGAAAALAEGRRESISRRSDGSGRAAARSALYEEAIDDLLGAALLGGGEGLPLEGSDRSGAADSSADQLDDPDSSLWGTIYGPPLIDIMKELKKKNKKKHRKKHHHKDDEAKVTMVGEARPNVYLNHAEAYALLLDDGAHGIEDGSSDDSSGDIGLASNILFSSRRSTDNPTPNHSPFFGKYSSHYFLLSSGWDAQVDTTHCSVASVAAVINSLRFLHPRSDIMADTRVDSIIQAKALLDTDGVDVPEDVPKYAPYYYADQSDVMLGECASSEVLSTHENIYAYPYGLGLDQVARLLQCHLSAEAGWTVSTTPLDRETVSVERMRDELKEVLADPNSRALINYHRTEAHQVGGGHFSPLAAYSPSTDSFLVLDVAKYKYPPVWIPAQRLWESMATYDNCGIWDYPEGQERLVGERMRHPKTEEERGKARVALGCRRTPRGYVVARRRRTRRQR